MATALTTNTLESVATQVMFNQPYRTEDAFVQSKILHSRRSISNGQKSVSFFSAQDVAPSGQDPNFYISPELRSGQLQQNNIFICLGMGFAVKNRAAYADGTFEAASRQIAVDAGTGAGAAASTNVTAAILLQEQIAAIMDHGLLNVSINNRKEVDSEYGLTNWPWPSGLVIDTAFAGATTVAASSAVFGSVNARNGESMVQNVRTFARPILVRPSTIIDVRYDFQATASLASPLTIVCFLMGKMVSPPK